MISTFDFQSNSTSLNLVSHIRIRYNKDGLTEELIRSLEFCYKHKGFGSLINFFAPCPSNDKLSFFLRFFKLDKKINYYVFKH